MESKLKEHKTCLIGLLTKNTSTNIVKVLKNVERYASCFLDYKCVIIDGYSTDATPIICKSWCKQDETRRFFFNQRSKNIERMPAITEARNMILDFFQSTFGENTYLLLLDSDSPNAESYSLDGFIKSIQQPGWNALFCNQRIKYYDLWALRDKQLEEDYQIKFRGLSWNGQMQKALKPFEQPKVGIDERNFYPVRSAFGGAGIYKTDCIKRTNARYSYLRQITMNNQIVTVQVCEHVPFHDMLQSNTNDTNTLYIACDWYIGEHQ